MKPKFDSEIEQAHAFQLESESDLIEAFNDKDQKRVLPPKGVSYPIDVRHYYAWMDSSRVYVYMVFKKPGWKSPVGVVFKRAYNGSQVKNSRVCDWCLAYGSSDQVGMLMVRLNRQSTIGMMLCLDLKCADRLEEAAELSGKSFEKLVKQLYEKIGRFYDGVLRETDSPDIESSDTETVH